MIVKVHQIMGAAVAQWIRLSLPSCRPGSNPKHTIYVRFLNCDMMKRQNKQKKWPSWPIFKKVQQIGNLLVISLWNLEELTHCLSIRREEHDKQLVHPDFHWLNSFATVLSKFHWQKMVQWPILNNWVPGVVLQKG